MTPEERLDHLDHLIAALAEERQKDHAEYKELWRDNERLSAEVWHTIGENQARIREMAAEGERRTAETDRLIRELSAQADSRAVEADKRFHEFERSLDERIDKLISVIRELASRKDK